MREEVTARFATAADLDFVRQDGYVSAEVVRRKVESREVVVAEWGGNLVGYLRVEYLWSVVPYIALIHVPAEWRGRGASKVLLRHLEEFLRAQGHEALYSSSQADEAEGQAWHRHNNFAECGIISGINRGGVGEVFFRKPLSGASPE